MEQWHATGNDVYPDSSGSGLQRRDRSWIKQDSLLCLSAPVYI